MSNILNQPNRRRVSTDRLNREDSQLILSFKGESSPTAAGEALPHSYSKTRFRSKGARLCHFDVEQAFVQSRLDEDVFLRLPKVCGSISGKIVRLNKSFYGLKQVSWS